MAKAFGKVEVCVAKGSSTDTTVKLSAEQFKWLLEGYDVLKMKPFETLHFDRV